MSIGFPSGDHATSIGLAVGVDHHQQIPEPARAEAHEPLLSGGTRVFASESPLVFQDRRCLRESDSVRPEIRLVLCGIPLDPHRGIV